MEEEMMEEVNCPWCRKIVRLDLPADQDEVKCSKCGKICEWWANGVIGEKGTKFYLTKRNPISIINI